MSNMWSTRLVTDFISGRVFRMTTPNAEKDKHMQHTDAFSRAARELEDLVKSRRPGAQTIQQMSDAKDYDEENLDDFDRAPRAARRKDVRESGRGWQGVQALVDGLDDEALFELGDELNEKSHEMLVSGRRARIRFPGAKGDSTLEPFERQKYVADDDIDEDFPEGRDYVSERNASIRGALGGDALSWRSQASRRGIGEDRYTNSKSFGGRSMSPLALIKSFHVIKSRLHAAMVDECLDPNVLLNFDAAGTESRLGLDLSAAKRALACVPPAVRARYGIPTIANNQPEVNCSEFDAAL